jgi:hypothetical protein
VKVISDTAPVVDESQIALELPDTITPLIVSSFYEYINGGTRESSARGIIKFITSPLMRPLGH